MSKENMNEEMKNKETVDNRRKSVHDEKRTELDKFKKQQLVDDIPLEDLKIEEKNNDKKRNSQSTSQSERKYKE
ncbi:hypothetical protein SAMN04487944_11396 [Gracilibacillus ureilyticus]|uniref:Uncharacterized protein n=1 Tax=Gracilibacillus ureilyticus TaxID=531814 RepID=A0A1H9TBU7_9BACI|nr:hypothetical protein [Gracilibacillus ureilyticus]SER94692.1 hypothetical protein SAMN04487944_11396 [Gracilibacillus ureilyticus]